VELFFGHDRTFGAPLSSFQLTHFIATRENRDLEGLSMSTGNPGLIGKAIRIKGELHGEEDLIIEGKVEGTIALKKNHLILERSAVITANVEVENVTIKGQMNGNTSASNRVEISADAKVVGDIKAPRVVMAEGARFRGAVDMEVKLPAGV
jgi:cytoskeletal protein CcmA (bactofilin family)